MQIGNITTRNDVIVAPMAGVTDYAFRTICKSFDVGLLVTEMVSISAMYFKDKKTHKLMEIDEAQRPLALQVFTADPDKFYAVMDEINATRFDILDLNMGCPVPKIVNNGEGSALMKTPELARKIIRTAVKYSNKPVTVKMRLGWDDTSINVLDLAKIADEEGVSAIAVHGRTREQQYSGDADWTWFKKVKQVVDVPVIGNGDVFSLDDAVRMKEETEVDGIMIGRGVQGNPWLIREVAHYLATGEKLPRPSLTEKYEVAMKHFDLLLTSKGNHIGVLEMRKHAAWYFKGIQKSSFYKNEINRTTNIDAVREVLYKAFLEA